jgi:2'-5' RNA ligase
MIEFKQYSDHSNGTYASLELSKESKDKLYQHIKQYVAEGVDPDSYHCTLCYSKIPVPQASLLTPTLPIEAEPESYEVFPTKDGKSCLVLRIKCQTAQAIHQQLRMMGASYDFPEYKAHITLASDHKDTNIPLPPYNLYFDQYNTSPLDPTFVVKNK